MSPGVSSPNGSEHLSSRDNHTGVADHFIGVALNYSRIGIAHQFGLGCSELDGSLERDGHGDETAHLYSFLEYCAVESFRIKGKNPIQGSFILR